MSLRWIKIWNFLLFTRWAVWGRGKETRWYPSYEVWRKMSPAAAHGWGGLIKRCTSTQRLVTPYHVIVTNFRVSVAARSYSMDVSNALGVRKARCTWLTCWRPADIYNLTKLQSLFYVSLSWFVDHRRKVLQNAYEEREVVCERKKAHSFSSREDKNM